MTEHTIEHEKDLLFKKISTDLLNFGVEAKIDGFARAAHVLDLLEELSARVVANCAVSHETVDEMCGVFNQNLKMLAHKFFDKMVDTHPPTTLDDKK